MVVKAEGERDVAVLGMMVVKVCYCVVLKECGGGDDVITFALLWKVGSATVVVVMVRSGSRMVCVRLCGSGDDVCNVGEGWVDYNSFRCGEEW